MTAAHMTTISGIPLVIPNETTDNGTDEFYISFNSYDTGIYGDITTALVFGQMERFYILNGDHRKGYEKLIAQGFNACKDYFNANIKDINKYSEK